MDSRSTLRSNNSTFWGLILAIALVLVLGLLTATGTFGLALFLPILVLVGIALVGSLWVLGMRAQKKMED